jgi:hypothetical protein
MYISDANPRFVAIIVWILNVPQRLSHQPMVLCKVVEPLGGGA